MCRKSGWDYIDEMLTDVAIVKIDIHLENCNMYLDFRKHADIVKSTWNFMVVTNICSLYLQFQ